MTRAEIIGELVTDIKFIDWTQVQDDAFDALDLLLKSYGDSKTVSDYLKEVKK